MKAIKNPGLPPVLSTTALRQLARHRGSCLTILLPPWHPGEAEGKRLATIQSLFHSLGEAEYASRRHDIEAELLEHGGLGGGPGLAIFSGRDFLEIYQAGVESAQIVAAQYCFLLPLLIQANAPARFFILGLSENLLRFFVFDQDHCEARELPKETPRTLEDFLGLKERVQNVQDQSPAGSSLGSMKTVQFGTSTQRETGRLNTERFFAAVDASLAPLTGSLPLLLMGTEEAVSGFRRAAQYCSLFPTHIEHGMRDLGVREITQSARECALASIRADGNKALRQVENKVKGDLLLRAPLKIARAAAEGRVQILCLEEPSLGIGAIGEAELLCNEIVAETLSHGGEVMTFSPEQNETSTKMAAALRY